MAGQAVGPHITAHLEAVCDHGRHGRHRHIAVRCCDQYIHLASQSHELCMSAEKASDADRDNSTCMQVLCCRRCEPVSSYVPHSRKVRGSSLQSRPNLRWFHLSGFERILCDSVHDHFHLGHGCIQAQVEWLIVNHACTTKSIVSKPRTVMRIFPRRSD